FPLSAPYSCFFSSCSDHPRDLHSFPTRRSSDLGRAEFHSPLGTTPIACRPCAALADAVVSTTHPWAYFTPAERGGFEAVCARARSEEHTSELQSLAYLVCRLLLEKKKIYTLLPN